MAFNEDDYLMISGLQHFQFCRRQWALIHIEKQWEENVRTLEGQHLHQKADDPFLKEKRQDKLIVRAMPIKSNDLKLTGICDVVEFVENANGISLAGRQELYHVFPVEYKRGKPKSTDADELQLVAQALCLEEMLMCNVEKGFLYYHEIRRRVEIPITVERKDRVKKISLEMQDYFHRRHTPKVKTGPHCNSCSLHSICMPQLMNKRSVRSYIEGKISE